MQHLYKLCYINQIDIIKVQLLVNMNANIQDDDQSSSNSQLFKKIYEKQRKKQEKANQMRLNKINAKCELRRMKDQKSIQEEDLNVRYRTREKHMTRQVSQAINPTPLQLKWHIYEKCPNLNLASVVDKNLLDLPIYKKKQQILSSIMKDQFVLITGQTGCGKSTQVPRIIYEYLRSINDTKSKIMCIQPRRLAVINLYNILSKQLSPQLIGYRIGMNKKTDQQNRIVFVTNGIFLQKIVHSTEFFEEFPFIILDEVHERDIDTDFILLTIKRIIRKFPKVRIILMSATIDNQLFRYYFASDHIDSILQQQNYYGKVLVYEHQRKKQKQMQRQQQNQIQIQILSDKQENVYKDHELQFMKSKFPCPAINVTEPGKFKRQYYYLDNIYKFLPKNVTSTKWGQIIFSQKYPDTHKELFQTVVLIIDQIYQLHKSQKDKCSILIFMPGLNQIQTISDYIASFFKSQQMKAFDVIHVHSSILNEQTSQKLHQTKNERIRLIISTNIAESSITVLGVKYVIDFCLTKEIRFDLKSRMQNLELVWTSKASCKQRAGRTGRVCDGIIFRLIEQQFYKKLPQYSTPQIQRSSLDKLILRIKLLHEGQQNDKKNQCKNQNNNIFADPGAVLGSAIQPPFLKNIDTAIKSLQFCGGIQIIDDEFKMTKLGRLYIDIPIDITYCKLLVISKLFGNYNDILILVSILSQSKAAIRKSSIQKNYKLYYDTIQNASSCDFLALINLYKKTEKFVHEYTKTKKPSLKMIKAAIKSQSNNLYLQTYAQVLQLNNDIDRRINNLMSQFFKDQFSQGQDQRQLERQFNKFIESMNPGVRSKDEKIKQNKDLMFKLTLISGFIENMLKIREPIFDEKQEKRLKLMKKVGIQHNNTICILGSTILKKPDTEQSQIKLINVWKNHIKQAMKIDNVHFTVTHGLSYLHFDQETDINKFLFYKFMEQSKNIKNYQVNEVNIMEQPSRYLKITDILKCFGQLDHMNIGRPVTFSREHTMFIDNFSINRQVNMNQNDRPKFLIANNIAKQSSRMITRYTSLLPQNIKYLEVISHLLFYPFVHLIKNKKNTKYEFIFISKKFKIYIPYELSNQQVQKANRIRQIIKDFLLLKKTSETYQLKKIKFRYFLTQFLYIHRRQKFEQDRWQQIFLKEYLQNNKQLKTQYQEIMYQNNAIIQQQPSVNYFVSKQFMNPIKMSPLKYSYFSNISIAKTDLLYRNQVYYAWKVKKLKEIEDIQNKILDNDSYLACGDNTCGLKLAKLKMVGPINQQIFRELYSIEKDNITELPFNQINNHFCSMLMSNNIDAQYKLQGCINGHYFGILIQRQKRIKILPFSNLMIIYPDGTAEQSNFEQLDMKYWKRKHDQKVQLKYKMDIKTCCFVCNQQFKSMKQLEYHIKDTKQHNYNVDEFRRNIDETIADKGEERQIKCQ